MTRRRSVRLEVPGIHSHDRPVVVVIAGDLVTFREKGRHVSYSLPFHSWVAMGFRRAAECHADHERATRRFRRSAVGVSP